jgi:hypothetical protein
MALVPPKLACDNNLGLSVSRKQTRQPRASGLAGSGRYTGAETDAVVPRLAVSNDRQAADLNAVTTISQSGDHANIVPPDNLRLPDALTIKYGPAPLLARFVLEGDKEARRRGVDLRLRHDFRELLHVAKTISTYDKLFRRLEIFNPDYTDFTPENSYWIAGYDKHGEIVLTSAGRIYDWRSTNLEREARVMFYGRDVGQQCKMTEKFSAAARLVTGMAIYAGAGWIRADYRGRQLSRVFPRLGRAYALSRWPIESLFTYVVPGLADNGTARGYGYRHEARSVFYPGSPWGDIELVLVSLSTEEAFDDLGTFMGTELSPPTEAGSLPASASTIRDAMVTKTSPEGVFHGSSSRS